jgi:hypothetical protein
MGIKGKYSIASFSSRTSSAKTKVIQEDNYNEEERRRSLHVLIARRKDMRRQSVGSCIQN